MNTGDWLSILFYILDAMAIIIGSYGSTHKDTDPTIVSELCEFFGWFFVGVFTVILVCLAWVW